MELYYVHATEYTENNNRKREWTMENNRFRQMFKY